MTNSILSANDIDYTIEIINRRNTDVIGNRIARVGSLGRNQNLAHEYKIYVHKKDYNYALGLIK